MPDLDDITYSRQATIDAFREYYRFLVDLYMDESEIIEPPNGGWPTISPDFGRMFGKTDEVLELLRNLPYIRQDSPGQFFPPHGSANCYWADWQAMADLEGYKDGSDLSGLGKTLKIGTEGCLDPVPSHVVGLTSGDRENKVFLLDTKLGVIHWPESDGGGSHRDNFDNDPSFIQPVDPWDLDERVPEDEVEWRHESPAWAITDFFELLKNQFRQLKWIPINAREVYKFDTYLGPSTDGVIPMIQKIFREHGWQSEQGGTYRKRECLEAVKAALEEHYPAFHKDE